MKERNVDERECSSIGSKPQAREQHTESGRGRSGGDGCVGAAGEWGVAAGVRGGWRVLQKQVPTNRQTETPD